MLLSPQCCAVCTYQNQHPFRLVMCILLLFQTIDIVLCAAVEQASTICWTMRQ